MKGNALITGTMLGIEDHGIMTCFLYLKQEGSGQGFGGFCLDDIPKKDKNGDCYGDRQPSMLMGFWVKRIMETVGVYKWEDLKGKHIRVDGEDYGQIRGIGHITDNKWFYPETEIKKLLKEKIK